MKAPFVPDLMDEANANEVLNESKEESTTKLVLSVSCLNSFSFYISNIS